jgi:hypothetical protein
MGGVGSGRQWSWDSKDTIDDHRSIDVRRWKRDGLLESGKSFSWQWFVNGEVIGSIGVRIRREHVILTYRQRSSGEDWKDEKYPIYLDWTDCHLGGRRPWFLCPFDGCGRRVAILYEAGIFACRQCLQLAYPSQREEHDYRAIRQANRIRSKLGWMPGIINGNGDKPKGMHWKTFERLSAEHDALVQVSLAGMVARLESLT